MDYLELIEQEFSFRWNGEVLFVGHPDRVRIYQNRKLAICSEYKFGFKEVQPADANIQLRCYLAMISEEYPVDDYYGAIYQPRISSKPIAVHYTRQDIEKARLEIKAIFDACFASDAPRRPSPQGCEYCRAQAICPEFKTWAFAVEKSAHLPSAQWSDETWDEFLTKRPIVEKFCKQRLEDAKLIKAANPDRLPGWNLKPGAEIRTISDLVKAWSALQSHMSAIEFSGECDVSIGGLEKLIWQKHQDDPSLGKLTQKGVKALVNDLLKDVLELKRNRPSLEKE